MNVWLSNQTSQQKWCVTGWVWEEVATPAVCFQWSRRQFLRQRLLICGVLCHQKRWLLRWLCCACHHNPFRTPWVAPSPIHQGLHSLHRWSHPLDYAPVGLGVGLGFPDPAGPSATSLAAGMWSGGDTAEDVRASPNLVEELQSSGCLALASVGIHPPPHHIYPRCNRWGLNPAWANWKLGCWR